MRKIICIIIILSCYVKIYSQTMTVYLSNGEVVEYQVSKVDSVVLKEASVVIPEEFACVDLGLPSGRIWTNMNIGADSQEKYGYFVAWGETVEKRPHYGNDNYYYFTNGNATNINKYNTSPDYGMVDNIVELENNDDVATTLLGDEFIIPSAEDIQELIENCDIIWTSLKGVKGATVKGPNGNELFFPAAGCYSYINPNTVSYYHEGNECSLWSRSLNNEMPSQAYCMELNKYWNRLYYAPRYEGLPVRAVKKD